MASTSTNTKSNTKEEQEILNDMKISLYERITDKSVQLTRWVFTLNNYTPEQDNFLKQTFGPKYCRILIYGYETAPTTGTPHLQGYINLLTRLTFNQMKNILGQEYHLYKARKNDLANYRYCTKNKDFYFYEAGLIGTNTEKSQQIIRDKTNKKLTKAERIEKAWELAKQDNFKDIDKDLLLLHGKELKRVKMEWEYDCPNNLYYDQGKNNYFHCHNLWLWGKTGTGKSFFLTYFITGLNHWWKKYCEDHERQFHPLRVFNHQKKSWWCGYTGEEVVVINEVNPLFCTWYANDIKEWVDQYPFNAEVKGSNLGKIRPQFFIFTSNYPMEKCFGFANGRELLMEPDGSIKVNYEDLEPMQRRMFQIERKKEDRTKLVEWPNFDMLTQYHDTLLDYKKIMQTVETEYVMKMVKKIKYCNYCKLDIINCKCTLYDTKTYCHICKGQCTCGRLDYIKKMYKNTKDSQYFLKDSNEQNSFIIMSQQKDSKLENDTNDISIIESSKNPSTPKRKTSDINKIKTTPIKKQRLSLKKSKGKEKMPTHEEDDIENFPDTPSPPKLERQNAVLIDDNGTSISKNNDDIEEFEEPKSSLPIPKTPEFSLIEDSEESIITTEKETNTEANCLNCGLSRKECLCKPETPNNYIPQLSNSQETFSDLKAPDDLFEKPESPKGPICTEPNYQIVFNLPNNRERQYNNIENVLTKGQFQSKTGTSYVSENQYKFIQPKINKLFEYNKCIKEKFEELIQCNSLFEILELKKKIVNLYKDKESKVKFTYEKNLGNNMRKKVTTDLNTFWWNDIYLPDCFKTICKQNNYYVKYYKFKNYEIFVNISEKHLIEEDEHNDDDHDFDIHQELDRSIEY